MPATSAIHAMEITAAAAQGGRKYMEDQVNIELVQDETGKTEYLFIAVYDGHGGPQASEFASKHLHRNIQESRKFNLDDEGGVFDAIREGFLKTHYDMLGMVEHWPATQSGYPCTAGTTASCVLICPRTRKIFIGHVGDSAVLLLDHTSGVADKVTEDHKPDSPEEKRRILKAGGNVGVKAGVSRVIWRRIAKAQSSNTAAPVIEEVPFLAIARALGDFWSLNASKTEYVVSPEPDVQMIELKDGVDFLLVASDGLTNVLDNKLIAQHVRKLGKGTSSHRRHPPNYAHYIMAKAFARCKNLRADNLSLVCVRFPPRNNDAQSNGHGSAACELDPTKIEEFLVAHPCATVTCGDDGSAWGEECNPVKVVYAGPMDRVSKQLSFLGPGFIATLRSNEEMEQTSDDEGASDEETRDDREKTGAEGNGEQIVDRATEVVTMDATAQQRTPKAARIRYYEEQDGAEGTGHSAPETSAATSQQRRGTKRPFDMVSGTETTPTPHTAVKRQRTMGILGHIRAWFTDWISWR